MVMRNPFLDNSTPVAVLVKRTISQTSLQNEVLHYFEFLIFCTINSVTLTLHAEKHVPFFLSPELKFFRINVSRVASSLTITKKCVGVSETFH